MPYNALGVAHSVKNGHKLFRARITRVTTSEKPRGLTLKALLVSAFDLYGGAARAAHRLHQGLRLANIDSQMLVQVKQSYAPYILGPKATSATAQITHGARVLLNQMPVKLYPNHDRTLFSPQWLYSDVAKKIHKLNPDIVNLHWTSGGYLQIESITKINKPIIWTLHDMWAFTGGCHYTQNCDRYKVSCGACPQLGSTKEHDLSRHVWQRKANAWKNHRFTLVALSHWMSDVIKCSPLLKDSHIEVIPNGLNTKIYRPFDPTIARDILGLPHGKKLLLSGSLDISSEKRKGSNLLLSALRNLQKTDWRDNLEIVVFGSSNPEKPIDLGLKVHYLGILNDDYSLALAYSAVDTFVAPSLQDNLPNTVMEALACGTPCIAFNIGGMPDMIEHLQNGYLTIPYQVDDLTKGITWILENQERHQKLSYRARQKITQNFSQEIQASRYQALFESILHSKESFNY